MNVDPIVLSIPIYFFLIGAELLIQQFSKQRLYRLNDAVTNISCGITSQLLGVFLKILSIGVYQLVFENFAIWQIPTNWVTLVVLFVAVDFFYYWAHRKSHEINLFWGGHVVHHQSEDYNLSVALRQGSFQVIWTFAFYLPLAVIGFKTLDFALMAGLTTVYQFWIHTETIKRMGVLEYIMNTPSHHRVHHGKDPKYIDKNHAGVFIVWDKMFGTFQEEQEKPTYGITRPINSWNPVWTNLEHYIDMFRKLPTIRGLGNKLRFIFNKPGWLPDDMGGYQAPKPIDKSDVIKYDLKSSARINFYVLFQYALVLGGTAFFLFQQSNFNMLQKLLITSAIVWTIVNCGALFENRFWVKVAEVIRLLSFSSTAIYLSYINDLSAPLVYGGMAFLLVSLSWFVFATKPKNRFATHA